MRVLGADFLFFLYAAACLYIICCNSALLVDAATLPSDAAVLIEFYRGLENPELLRWPISNGDPCGVPRWPHVYCSDNRVSQIQVQGMGLKGPLPQNINRLSFLSNVGLQRNRFSGNLPTFKGLSQLRYAYLDYNDFDVIPSDFFHGLTSLQAMSLETNPFFNQTQGGWILPNSLQDSVQLVNFSCSNCNLIGSIPEFFGRLPSLTFLSLSENKLTGRIPSSFAGSNLQILRLNSQDGDGLTGSVDILTSMLSLTEIWLHGNSFTGKIPWNITQCSSLKILSLNNNFLTGVVPPAMATMDRLQTLQLNNNKLVGPVPILNVTNYSYQHNSFCQLTPGAACSPEVDALLGFLEAVDFPLDLVGSWSGNSPCSDMWLGITCSSDDKVTVINLPNHGLKGSISPSIAHLESLLVIRLDGNNLSDTIPANLTQLKSLKILNLTSNNLEKPVPIFPKRVTLLIDDNPFLKSTPQSFSDSSIKALPPIGMGASVPPRSSVSQSRSIPKPIPVAVSNSDPVIPSSLSSPPTSLSSPPTSFSRKSSVFYGIIVVVGSVVIILFAMSACCYCRRKKRDAQGIVHPDRVDGGVNVEDEDSTNRDREMRQFSELSSSDSEYLIKSTQLLREVTENFASKNEVGRGGFGVVYRGKLDDGRMIAVKRMEASIMRTKGTDEFLSEIAVLSKVRHRNLVSMLGYSVGENEKLLVYEYMPLGALSEHLFYWKNLGFDPLSWKQRVSIALDVARGMEYLHKLAHHCFIHRDLKPSNILLGHGYRAKVSDFGLVKLAPDGINSIATTLAGTFGYLAPEYAITGKVTTKVDVYSFGVILMELVTGLKALDEDRREETRHLPSWFPTIKFSNETLTSAIDPSLLTDGEDDDRVQMLEGVRVIAELACHCTESDPQKRPEIGHSVRVLAPLVEKWQPGGQNVGDDDDGGGGIDFRKPLLQLVKSWQSGGGCNVGMSFDDSKQSIPSNELSLPSQIPIAAERLIHRFIPTQK